MQICGWNNNFSPRMMWLAELAKWQIMFSIYATLSVILKEYFLFTVTTLFRERNVIWIRYVRFSCTFSVQSSTYRKFIQSPVSFNSIQSVLFFKNYQYLLLVSLRTEMSADFHLEIAAQLMPSSERHRNKRSFGACCFLVSVCRISAALTEQSISNSVRIDVTLIEGTSVISS